MLKQTGTRRTLIVVAALVIGLVVVFGVTTTYAQGPGQSPCGPGNGTGWSGRMGMGGRGMMGNGSMMGGSMMGQNPAQNSQNCPGMGGMMGMMGMGRGMMMGSGMMGGTFGPGGSMMSGNFGPGRGMMGAWTPPADLAPAAGKPLTLEKATAVAKAYIAAWNSRTSLKLAEVMQFSDNFYGAAVETSTERGAFEFLIDPQTGIVYLEPGPNMMWNLRYGMMAGVTGNTQTDDGAKMTIAAEQAIKNAQAYLDKALPGTKAEDKALAFYGYYTLDFLRDGKIAGMLSVNGYTGQVWVHTWHGNFVAETE